MKPIDSFYDKLDEPIKGCMIALKYLILSLDDNITESLKYKLPFFSYKGKSFCYLWIHKKFRHPYIGLMEGHRFENPMLLKENRSRIKILLVDPDKDLSIEEINYILTEAINLYKNGIIKIKA